MKARNELYPDNAGFVFQAGFEPAHPTMR